MHLPWVDFRCVKVGKMEVLEISVFFLKQSPEENFHSYQQIDRCETPKNLC